MKATSPWNLAGRTERVYENKAISRNCNTHSGTTCCNSSFIYASVYSFIGLILGACSARTQRETQFPLSKGGEKIMIK